MAILDKLIEKKEIHCYIKARIAHLKATAREQILSQEPRKRELLKRKIAGRIEELERLDAILRQCKVKAEALKDWPYVYAKTGRLNKEE